MRVPEFERRPSAEVILRKWLRVRDQIDPRAMEDTPLQFRDRARQRSPYNSDSATSANSRSHKRDISSILNKVLFVFSLVQPRFNIFCISVNQSRQTCFYLHPTSCHFYLYQIYNVIQLSSASNCVTLQGWSIDGVAALTKTGNGEHGVFAFVHH